MRGHIFCHHRSLRPALIFTIFFAMYGWTSPVRVALAIEAGTVKISIEDEGLYRITYAELVNAGFDPGLIEAHNLKLSNRGKEIPLYLAGGIDGAFDPTDELFFYGTAIDSAYTEQNVYWLSLHDTGGKRMKVWSRTATGQDSIPTHYWTTRHFEEDTAYWQNMPMPGEDRWFWGQRLSPHTENMPNSRSYAFPLQNASLEDTARLRVRLKGYTSLGHHTRIILNGHIIDDQSWQGQIPFTHRVTIPQHYLRTGENELVVEALDAGSAIDQILVNWIEVGYWHPYVVDEDQLLFSAPDSGDYQFEIRELSSADVFLLDVTDPATPIRMINFAIAEVETGITVKFDAVATQNSRYYVTTSQAVKSATKIELAQSSDWKSPHHGADYIIITHADFHDDAQRLANHRRAQGLRAVVVRVEEIYNEFSNGQFDPTAIRNFLRHAFYQWQSPSPSYVVLLGDANQDYKDNLQSGTPNYVPSYNLASFFFGEISSDNWFVDIKGNDRLPEMHIGRLAASSAEEASIMVDKIIRYELIPDTEGWQQRHTIVADAGSLFEPITEKLIAVQPTGYTHHRIYADRNQNAGSTLDIINGFNLGSGLITYVGHGSYDSWGIASSRTGSMFDVSDLTSLTNGDRLSIVVTGNCLNGFFAGTGDNPSLAEELQRLPHGGAVAVWAPSGLGYPADHGRLLEAFYASLSTSDEQTVGAAITAAKLELANKSRSQQELIDTYVLFGDPATKVSLPGQ